MSRTILRAAALTFALVAGLAPVAATASPDTGHHARRREARDTRPPGTIDAAAALTAVRSAGFTDVRSLDWEHGRWEVRATGEDGRLVRLYVEATTGAVVPRGR